MFQYVNIVYLMKQFTQYSAYQLHKKTNIKTLLQIIIVFLSK